MAKDLIEIHTPGADAENTLDEVTNSNNSGGAISVDQLPDPAVPAPHEEPSTISTALVKIQTPHAAADVEAIATDETIRDSMSGGSINFWELPKIIIESGANPNLILQTLEGDIRTQQIELTIGFEQDYRAFHKKPYAKGGKQPPDCTSFDCITGNGQPGGECSSCPMAEDGAGQRCKLRKYLIVLYGDELLALNLSPTSRKAVRQFLLKLHTRGIPYYEVLLSMVAQKAEDFDFGTVALKYVRRLTPEEAQVPRKWHEFLKKLGRC
jgi:hypothetical protein